MQKTAPLSFTMAPQKTGAIAQDEERALNKLLANSKSWAIKRIESDANSALLILDVRLSKNEKGKQNGIQ